MLSRFALWLAFGSLILHASAALAQLPSGDYTIVNKATDKGVGLTLSEDFSPVGKPIVSVPIQDAVWRVYNLQSGHSILRIIDGVKNENVYIASPSDGTVSVSQVSGIVAGIPEWVIEHQKSGFYTIVTRTGKKGWDSGHVIVDGVKPVDCVPLAHTSGSPPVYLDSELWKFIRIAA